MFFTVSRGTLQKAIRLVGYPWLSQYPKATFFIPVFPSAPVLPLNAAKDHEPKVEIGIIGGTGIYDPFLLEDTEAVSISTPYGPTSDAVYTGYFKGHRIAFLARHGKRHSIPPHKVNYRANIDALRQIGAHRIIGASAVGSLLESYRPGEFAIPDQFVDRTKGRRDTYYDGDQVCHVSSADPFCPELRSILIGSGRDLGLSLHENGTYVCIEGPRFSTRAESRLFREWKANVIGMTLYPECVLARELQLCYASVAMITDYDVWAEKPVSVAEVKETMSGNVANLKKLILASVPKVPVTRGCACAHSLDEALV